MFFHFTEESLTIPLSGKLLKYGAGIFIVGLLALFTGCTIAIFHLVRPLRQFADAAVSIAEGNLDTPLPKIDSNDELLQLRNSFEYMQTSLKQHIEDLQVTTAGKERMQSELVIARDIQMGMIPTIFPERDDLELFASMTPAKEVGGDLYDFIIEGDQLFFIIGDVAGKGVPASLYMAVTRTLFRNLAGNYQSAANIMREMNHAIASTNDSMIFVTAFVGVLDLRTHHLTYCNAAHNAPALLTNSGGVSLLEVDRNLPIGIEDHYQYEEQQMDFPEGTALLLYTDGLTEAMYLGADGKRRLFGEERVLHDLKKNRTASATEVIDFLKQHVTVFAAGTVQRIMKNEMTEVSRMRGFFFSVCREHGIGDDMAKTLNLAIEEWVANVVNYAYPKGTRGHVELTARVEAPLPSTQESEISHPSTLTRYLSIIIKDHGTPFDRPIGGLGIHLVRNIMDTMHYERTADGYNVLTLTKAIPDAV